MNLDRMNTLTEESHTQRYTFTNPQQKIGNANSPANEKDKDSFSELLLQNISRHNTAPLNNVNNQRNALPFATSNAAFSAEKNENENMLIQNKVVEEKKQDNKADILTHQFSVIREIALILAEYIMNSKVCNEIKMSNDRALYENRLEALRHRMLENAKQYEEQQREIDEKNKTTEQAGEWIKYGAYAITIIGILLGGVPALIGGIIVYGVVMLAETAINSMFGFSPIQEWIAKPLINEVVLPILEKVDSMLESIGIYNRYVRMIITTILVVVACVVIYFGARFLFKKIMTPLLKKITPKFTSTGKKLKCKEPQWLVKPRQKCSGIYSCLSNEYKNRLNSLLNTVHLTPEKIQLILIISGSAFEAFATVYQSYCKTVVGESVEKKYKNQAEVKLSEEQLEMMTQKLSELVKLINENFQHINMISESLMQSQTANYRTIQNIVKHLKIRG